MSVIYAKYEDFLQLLKTFKFSITKDCIFAQSLQEKQKIVSLHNQNNINQILLYQ
jgi:hypothetical protein